MLDRREPRPVHDPWRYQDVLVEEERAGDGRLVQVATIFLTGRECPWRCVMCDLGRYTTPGDTPPGAIPAQVRAGDLLAGAARLEATVEGVHRLLIRSGFNVP